MALPPVAAGDPHAAAHNNERTLINTIQDVTDPTFKAALDAEISTIAPVESVNGYVGEVVLDAINVGAATPADVVTASTADRNRVNHTGVQPSTSISDLLEAVQDILGLSIAAGSNMTMDYNDTTGVVTLSAVVDGAAINTDPEVVRDTMGNALVGAGLISVVVNDAGDTITISTTATLNSSDAALRDRSTHTGTQPFTSLSGLIADTQMMGRLKATAILNGLTGNDWNNATSSGWYTATGAANAPGGAAWYLGHVVAHTVDWVTQEVWDFTNVSPGGFRFRRYCANGVWSGWVQVLDEVPLLDARYEPLLRTVNSKTASYTLLLSDATKIVEFSSVAAVTLTVPTNAAVAFPIGTQIQIENINTGDLTISGAGVTFQSPAGLKLTDQYATAVIRKVATDTWRVSGRTSV